MTRRFLVAALVGAVLAIVPVTAGSAAPPLVKLTAKHINCPNQPVADGPVQCGLFSITNNTTSPITMGSHAVDGEGAEFSLQLNLCAAGQVLQPGFSCTVFVNFDPTSVGRHSITFIPVSQGGGSLGGKVGIVGKGT